MADTEALENMVKDGAEWVDFDGNPIDTAALEDRVMGDDAEGWRPQPGDIVSGVVVEIDEGTNEYGDYPLLIIRRKDGTETSVHCFHTVLSNRINKLVEKGRLSEGNLIAIRYTGQGESTKRGQDGAYMYRVAVQR